MQEKQKNRGAHGDSLRMLWSLGHSNKKPPLQRNLSGGSMSLHDYMENGYSQEAAMHKALLQMGDPKEIGYSFTDYQAMKIRKMKLIGSKILSGLLVFGLIVFLIVSSGESESLQLKEIIKKRYKDEAKRVLSAT